MLLVAGSVVLSVVTAPADTAQTSGSSLGQAQGPSGPLTNTNLSSMLLDAGDIGPGVERVEPVPPVDAAVAEPPCLAKVRLHTETSRASIEMLFTNGDGLVEQLGAYSSTRSGRRAYETEVHTLDGCRHFDLTIEGQTISASISPGLPHVGRLGNELKAYRVDLSQGGLTLGADLVVARKGVVDLKMLLAPIAYNSSVIGQIATKAVAKIGAPVPVSLT